MTTKEIFLGIVGIPIIIIWDILEFLLPWIILIGSISFIILVIKFIL